MKDINIRWNFSYLAGYALKDGIKFEKAESLDDVCNFLDDAEVFYFKKDTYKKSLIGTDEEAFMVIKNLWNERWNNDGGWGELTANTYDGIVLALKNYDFNFYGEEEPGSIAKLSIQETEERYEAKIAQLKEQLKAKDERIEAQSSVIIACQNAILQKDERITELEAKAIQKEQAKAENFVNIDVSGAALGSASTLKNILQKLEDNE